MAPQSGRSQTADRRGMYISLSLLNSGVEVHQILQDVARSSTLKFLKSELRYSNPFGNVKASIKNESAVFANYDLKLVAMA